MQYKKIFYILLFISILFSCVSFESKEVNGNDLAAKENNLETVEKNDYKNNHNLEYSKEKSIEPFTENKLLELVSEKIPWNFKPITTEGNLLATIHDLDKNGYKDVLVTVFEGVQEEEHRLNELSKTSRLFNADEKSYNYYLLIFYQYSGELILRYTVPVSQEIVFTGVKPFEIRKGSDFPYALLFSFRTHSGIKEELIILSGFGITRFTIKENLSEITIIQDIDDDGFMDIIVHEQGYEEGTGYETFITWYKWNKRKFYKHNTTNIVRNLREFFQLASNYLRAGEISEFLNFALDPETLLGLKRQGLSDSEIMALIFKPEKNLCIQNDFFNGAAFSAVVFPEILETPFSYEKRNNLHHQVTLKLNKVGEAGILFVAGLKMNKNPFGKRQFCFSVEEKNIE